jgi:hypothetical protein
MEITLDAGGKEIMAIVGLADKAVAESRERVRSALHAIGLALPNKRITVNLARRPAEGRQPLRSPDRAGLAYGDGRAPDDRDGGTRCHGRTRSTARSSPSPACCRGDGARTRTHLHLPARLRPRKPLGRRLGDHRCPSLVALVNH